MTPKTPSAAFETTATEGTIYSDVQVKNPFDFKLFMLLKPKNKAEFVSQIKALPPEKRKVVVLAGRHLHEGTRNLAVRHYKEWEKRGAVTVLTPAAWTPHGFWREMEKTAIAKGKRTGSLFYAVLRKAQEVPQDEALIALLERTGVRASVVNLHGEGSYNKSRLSLFVPQNAPDGIKLAVRLLHQSQLEKPISINWVPPKSDLSQHPWEVLVEHNYAGKPAAKKMIPGARIHSGPLAHSYLRQPRVTKADLNAFEKEHLPILNKLITFLARTGQP